MRGQDGWRFPPRTFRHYKVVVGPLRILLSSNPSCRTSILRFLFSICHHKHRFTSTFPLPSSQVSSLKIQIPYLFRLDRSLLLSSLFSVLSTEPSSPSVSPDRTLTLRLPDSPRSGTLPRRSLQSRLEKGLVTTFRANRNDWSNGPSPFPFSFKTNSKRKE